MFNQTKKMKKEELVKKSVLGFRKAFGDVSKEEIGDE